MKRLILSAILALTATAAWSMPPDALEAYLRKASLPERRLIETFVVSCGTSLNYLNHNNANASIPANKICNRVLAQWEADFHPAGNKAADDLSDLLQAINTDIDPLAIGMAYSLLLPLSRALQATTATAAEQPASP